MNTSRNKYFAIFSSILLLFVWVACSSQTPSPTNTVEIVAQKQDCNSTTQPISSEWKGGELHQAIMSLKLSVLKNLLKKKPNINEKDSSGNTPLHLALSRRIPEPSAKSSEQLLSRTKKEAANQLEIAKLLIKNGADVNARGFAGRTPLLNAITLDESISAQTVNLLLAKKSNLDTQDNQGFTPLMEAARTNKINLIKILLAKGADKDLKNCQQKTALMLAEEGGFTKAAGMLK
jgi:ankyrin repeat protein